MQGSRAENEESRQCHPPPIYGILHFDASIRIYLITPFEEAYEIRYINTDRLNYYQSEPVPILYSKEDHESSKVQTTQVRQYSIHGGIKGTIKDNFPEVARDLED